MLTLIFCLEVLVLLRGMYMVWPVLERVTLEGKVKTIPVGVVTVAGGVSVVFEEGVPCWPSLGVVLGE
jgi:hypothetical protein